MKHRFWVAAAALALGPGCGGEKKTAGGAPADAGVAADATPARDAPAGAADAPLVQDRPGAAPDMRLDGATPVGLDRIPGPPGDPAAMHLPNLPFPPADPAMFAWHGATRRAAVGVSRRDLVLRLKRGATVAEVNDLLASLNARLVGSLPRAGLVLARMPEAPTAQPVLAAAARLRREGKVAAAMAEDALLGPQRLPPNRIDAKHFAACSNEKGELVQAGVPCPAQYPRLAQDRGRNWTWDASGLSGTWGLRASRFPQAWNLRDHIVRSGLKAPEVAVVDSGFTPAHEDLAGLMLGTENRPPRTAAGDDSYHDHGTAVAGFIAATWDNPRGIAGALPIGTTTHGLVAAPVEPLTPEGMGGMLTGRRHAPSLATTGGVLGQLVALIESTQVRVINNSYGLNFACDEAEPLCVNPATMRVIWTEGDRDVSATWREYMDRWGDLYHEVISDAVARAGRGVLLTASAGNCGVRSTGKKPAWGNGYHCTNLPAGFAFEARDNSPIANAAVRHGGTFYLAVEALAPEGVLSELSNRNGSVAAPGELVRTLEAGADQIDGDADEDPLYQTGDGTSYAAPVAAGLAALLWTLEPKLPAERVNALIVSTRQPNRNIDAFAAVLALDGERKNQEIQRALADLDDGTADGNLRWDLTRDGCAAYDEARVEACEPLAPAVRGDGTVDLRDFRVLRDALVALDSASAAGLVGHPASPRRDLNQDGCVPGEDGRPRKVRGAGAELDCTGAPAESAYPRADLDGDGKVDRMADLKRLTDVFGSGAGAVTLGYTGAQLGDLLDSGDIHLDLAALVAAPGAAAAEALTIEAPGLAAINLADRTKVPVLTLRRGASGAITVRALALGREVACRKADVPSLKPGEDVRVRPDQPCETALRFWLEVERAGDGLCTIADAGWRNSNTQEGKRTIIADPSNPMSPQGCMTYPTGKMSPHARMASASEGPASATSRVSIGAATTANGGAEFTVTVSATANASSSGPVGGASQFTSNTAFWIKSDLDPTELQEKWRTRVVCTGGATASDASLAGVTFQGPAGQGASPSDCAGQTFSAPMNRFSFAGTESFAAAPPVHFFMMSGGSATGGDPLGPAPAHSSRLDVTVRIVVEPKP